MGLFGKKKTDEPSVAAQLLADREKVRERINESGTDPNIASRMTSYTSPQSALSAPAAPLAVESSNETIPSSKSVQQMLADLKSGHNQTDTEKAKQESIDAVDNAQRYIAGLKNTDMLRQVEVEKATLTAEERSTKDKLENDEISRLHGSFSNKGFLTEVKGEVGGNISAGMSDKEIGVLTSSLKNKSILTEVQGAERPKQASTAQQIAELERVSDIVGGLTNTAIRGSAAAGNTTDENEDKEEK